MRALLFLFDAVVTTLKMAGDANASALQRLKIYGTLSNIFVCFHRNRRFLVT